MIFIGVITEKKNRKCIYKILRHKLEKEYNIIMLEKASAENYKNIKFETILINSNAQEEFDNQEYITKILQNSNYIIVNSDVEENLNLIQNLDKTIITFGFEHKSTITASSVEDNRIILSIQRNIRGFNGKNIDIQEIEKELQYNDNKYNTHNRIGIMALEIMYDI